MLPSVNEDFEVVGFMGTFRRVEGDQAGPTALGILIPPSKRTFVILRPRSLTWDLVLLRPGDELVFHDLAHDEASAAAQSLYRLLRDWAAGGPGDLEPTPHPRGTGFVVRARLGPLTLLACLRLPGQPYQPLICSDEESARASALALREVLCPGAGVEQELYFNVRFFDRP
jgi:hypothetical protein